MFKKSLITLALVMVSVSGAQAASGTASQGGGKVTFKGSIISAPCSINPASIDQTVSLGMVSDVALANGGTSIPQPFDIKLTGCSISTAKTVSTTFTGAADPDSANKAGLGVTGTAKGAAIILTDGASKQITLGTATSAQTIQNGNNTLQFSAYLQGNTGKTIVPGDFQGVTDFTLSYQ